MDEKKIELDELNSDELKQKRKIKLIIISKKGKSDEEKEESKITLKKEKGKINIRMENITQNLNKKKIDKALKSLIKNISEFNLDKNKGNICTSIEHRTQEIKNIFLDEDKNDYYDIYLEKSKKDVENINKQKKEEIKEEDILFQKIKIFEKEKEQNLKKIQNINNDEKNMVINDDIKVSNRELLKENENMNDNMSTNREKENSFVNKNNFKNSNLNINNFFRSNKNKNDLIIMNITKTKELEENKNDVSIYNLKNVSNNNNINNINNMSRNIDGQLNLKKNSELYNQSTNFFKKAEQNVSDSNFRININYNNNLKNQINFKAYKNICSICDVKYASYFFYVAECHTHFLCKKCAKTFYEEKIEMGAKELFCPFIFCKKKFLKSQAKKFLSNKHYKMLVEEEKTNNFNSLKLRNNYNNNNKKEMKNYSENHVLDINNNKIFYNFNKNKNIFCSRCNNQSLFCREKQLFMRCLFCNFEQCKYCFKEYTQDHFDMNSNNYCRIYYRDSDIDKISKSKMYLFLKQILLVFASFFLIIISFWKLSKNMFFNCFFKLNENNNNCILFYIKIILIYILTFLIFAIFLPINIIMFPWFPSFLAIFDY